MTKMLFGEIDCKDSTLAHPHKLSGSVTFVSQYISRGISATFRQPAVQGELKYEHRSGFYFKSWGSNVDGTSNYLTNTSLEWDLLLGYSHQFFKTPLHYDIGFVYYYYPGGKADVPANTRFDSVEYFVSINYKGFEIKLYQTLTDFFGNNASNPPTNYDKDRPVRPNGHSYRSPYLEANLEWHFHIKWRANFHLGHQGVTNYPQLNYLDWSASLTRTFDWFDISVSYVETTARKAFYTIPNHAFHPKRIYLGGATFVAGITHKF